MQQPPVLPGYDPSSEVSQRAPDESLLTYTAASPPRTHGVPQWDPQRLGENR
ncbi:hypothetical protein AVEN_229159-1, partial [Araneus ventricosus]